MKKSSHSVPSPVIGMLVAASLLAAPFQTERAIAVPTTNPYAKVTEQSIKQLNDPDPAARQHARLVILNLSGDSCQMVEEALAHDDLPPAVRPVLQIALPRLQARARIQAEQAKDYAFARTERDDWERVGHKDEKWNTQVEKGIDLFANRGVATRRAAHKEFEKAIAAGCDDPLVLYLNTRSLADLPENHYADVLEGFHVAAGRMLASDYPAARKLLACARYVGISKKLPSDVDIDQMLKLALESPNDPNATDVVVPEFFYAVYPKLVDSIGREAAFNKLYPTFEKAMPGAWIPLYFKAQFEVKWAWDARGDGFANTVTPEGWKLFGERIAAARSALEKAWEIDPTQSAIAREMITVCMAQSDRNGLEMWYERGIKANPDDYMLCRAKYYALLPRWLGSHEEMLDFGHQCAATQNIFGGIPDILIEIHEQIAAEVENPQEYFKQPPVWADTYPIFENRIALYSAKYDRSRFAQWAAKCGHWDVVAAQCEKLGDKPDRTIFPDLSVYEALRTKAKEQTQGK